MNQDSTSPRRRRSLRFALEPRMMFDGAMATSVVAAAKLAPPAVVMTDSRQADVVGLAQSAATAAVADIGAWAARLAAAADLARLFPGDSGTTTANLNAMAALLATPNTPLPEIQLRSGTELRGAPAAFTAAGPDGAPKIYLNADWLATQPTQAQVEAVLIEEIGHSLDSRINGNADSAGDEGEAFAVAVLGPSAIPETAAEIAARNDHAVLILDGRQIAVEEAAPDPLNINYAPMSFNSATNKVGTGTHAGDIVLYDSVITVGGVTVDAIVKTVSIDTGVTITAFDSTDTSDGNQPSGGAYFSPRISSSSARNGNGVTFQIDFITHGSYLAGTGTAITLQNVRETTYDIDLKQYQQFAGFTVARLNNGSTLQYLYDSNTGLIQFKSLVSTNASSGDINYEIQADYASMSTTTFKIGSYDYSLVGGAAFFYINFGTGSPPSSFSTSVTSQQAGAPVPVTVTDVTVSEASPYAVFTVSGTINSNVVLTTASGGATKGTDFGSGLEYYNGSAWVSYTAGSNVSLGAGGSLLVRSAVTNDAGYEGPETFTLTATPTTGTAGTGTGTITDDASSTNVFLSGNTTATPTAGTADDDRSISVNSVTVSESSPYAVFTVSAEAGQAVTLASASGSATKGTDFGSGLEYYNGSAWVSYAGGNVTIGGGGTLLVRTSISNDASYEGSEAFSLTASYATGSKSAAGTGTIVDDGSSTNEFLVGNTTGTPTAGTADDDSVVSGLNVNDVTVSEASPYIVFAVTGIANTDVVLTTSDGTAQAGSDFGNGLEYYDGSAWVSYTAGSTVSLGSGGSLLVRSAITNDATFEGPETFTLTATPTVGSAASGTGTLTDDASSTNQFLVGNITSTPTAGTADDDRAISVNSVTVSEASPFIVFTVSAEAGQAVTLATASGTAAKGTDFGNGLEYYDGSAWVSYTAGSTVTVAGSGTLLVRSSVTNDASYEGPEGLTLTASYVTGSNTADGTGTITDDASSSNVFLAGNTTGTATAGTADDDRSLSVSNVTVSEASPYIVFTVSGEVGQDVTLAAASGTATKGTDFGSGLEYYDGSAWVSYTAGSNVTIGGGGTLLVRTSVTDDATFEGPEALSLTASYATGSTTASGTGTLTDDGSSTNVFLAGNTTGTATAGTADDDRAISVNNVTVSEASPYIVFTVSGEVGQDVTLATASGTATQGTDFGSGLEYYDGSAWVGYNPGSNVTIGGGGTLLVRTDISNDAAFEGPEGLTLTASYVTGSNTADGTGTITDNASSSNVFLAGNTTGTATGGTADDDRAISVNNVTVSEASPYIVFTVSGEVGQDVTLAAASGTATKGTDFGSGLEYYNGSAWVSYTAGSNVTIGGGGTLLVRSSVTNDATFEGAEALTLTASYATGSATADGTGTIVDNASSANVFLAGNTSGTATAGTADDDRGLGINNVTVSESSPYIVFTLSAEAGQDVTLATASGTATKGADFGSGLEYFNGTAWVSYSAGSNVTIGAGGTLLVRTSITNDSAAEGAEAFALTASYATGSKSAAGSGTLVDDGSSTNVFLPGNNTGTPSIGTADDDRPSTIVPPVITPPIIPPAPPAPPGPPNLGSYPGLIVSAPYTGAAPTAPRPAEFTTESLGLAESPYYRNAGRITPFGDDVSTDIIVNRTVPPLPAQPGGETIFTLPRDLFRYSNPQARISLEARLSDGNTLPSWISIDFTSGKLVANAPANFLGIVEVVITATDNRGHSASTTLQIRSTDQISQWRPDDAHRVAALPTEAWSLFADTPLGQPALGAGQGSADFATLLEAAAQPWPALDKATF